MPISQRSLCVAFCLVFLAACGSSERQWGLPSTSQKTQLIFPYWPATYDFSDVPTRGTAEATFFIQNISAVSAQSVDEITGWKASSPFSFKGGTFPGTGGTCQEGKLSANSQCSIVVSFQPSSEGSYTDQLPITYDDGEETQRISLTLSGRGYFSYENRAELIFSARPESHNFSYVALNRFVEQRFVIRNIGGIEADDVDDATSWTLVSPFSFKGGVFPGTGGTCQKGKLSANSECSIVVSFQPTLEKIYSDELVIQYKDAGENRNLSLSLSGIGDLCDDSIGPFGYGNGTDSPYLICTPYHLSAIRSSLNSHFKITRDLVLSSPMAPIGSDEDNSFQGTLDGGKHILTNLSMDCTSGLLCEGAKHVGLFGHVGPKGIIQNLTLVGASVRGNANVGGVAGSLLGILDHCNVVDSKIEIPESSKVSVGVGGLVGSAQAGSKIQNSSAKNVAVGGVRTVGGIAGLTSGTIENTTSNITVTASESDAGGIAGILSICGTITHCQAKGEVHVEKHSVAGGLVGLSWTFSTIEKSSFEGLVEAIKGEAIGGLVGSLQGRLSQSFSKGSVRGKAEVGGAVGLCYGFGLSARPSIKNVYSWSTVERTNKDGSKVAGLVGAIDHCDVENSYAKGEVRPTNTTKEKDYIRGFIGYNKDSDVSLSYWDYETSKNKISEGGLGLPTSEMTNPSTFTLWNNTQEKVWRLTPLQYPTLQWETVNTSP